MELSANTIRALGALGVFIWATAIVFFLLQEVSRGVGDQFKIPHSLHEVVHLKDLLAEYIQEHFAFSLFVFATAYLYKQTFAIPGSMLMNVLAGAMFGVWPGWITISICSAAGSTAAFFLSRFIVQPFIVRYFPEKIDGLRTELEKRRGDLMAYLLGLRLVPFTPNWFLNLVAPILGVPLDTFFISVFLGLMPYNFICCQSGDMISHLTSTDDIFGFEVIVQLILLAVVVVGFTIFKNRLKRGMAPSSTNTS